MENKTRDELIGEMIPSSQDSKTKDELLELFNKLCSATFRGVGTGKYYPKESQTAHYLMEYASAKMTLRHKSLSASDEERFEIFYRSADDFNPVSMRVYVGELLHKSCSSPDEIKEFFGDELTRFVIVYLFKDPRAVLFSSEAVCEIAPIEGVDKAYRVLALDHPSMSQALGDLEFLKHCQMFGPSVIAEFYLKDGELKMMRLRIFMGRKEIWPQNMDIEFQYR